MTDLCALGFLSYLLLPAISTFLLVTIQCHTQTNWEALGADGWNQPVWICVAQSQWGSRSPFTTVTEQGSPSSPSGRAALQRLAPTGRRAPGAAPLALAPGHAALTAAQAPLHLASLVTCLQT